MKQVLNRLREPSTWSGLAGLAVMAGMTQEEYTQYVLVGTGVIGFALSVFFPEQGKRG